MYKNAFAYFKMGYASAMAWLLFLTILIITLIIFRSARRWVYYGGVDLS
jgi:multiple sugar transport system permease protein